MGQPEQASLKDPAGTAEAAGQTGPGRAAGLAGQKDLSPAA